MYLLEPASISHLKRLKTTVALAILLFWITLGSFFLLPVVYFVVLLGVHLLLVWSSVSQAYRCLSSLVAAQEGEGAPASKLDAGTPGPQDQA